GVTCSPRGGAAFAPPAREGAPDLHGSLSRDRSRTGARSAGWKLMDPTPLLDSATTDFYRGAMRALKAADVPFLVGGAYGLRCYTGVTRHSKDFDIFV